MATTAQTTTTTIRAAVNTIFGKAGLALLVVAAASACAKSPTSPSPGDGTSGGQTPTVTNVVIAGNLSVPEGGTSQLVAMAMMSDGTQQDVSTSSVWASSNPTVATVSGTGLVSSLATGTTDVSAAYQGRTARATAQVSAAMFRFEVVVQSVTALDTCDNVTQGLSTGEFAVRVLSVETDGRQSTLVDTGSYPGNTNNLRVYNLGRNQSRSLNVRRTFVVDGTDGEFVRLQFNATEWDEQIVVIPPSTRPVPDSKMNDRSSTRTHRFSNGAFSGLGPNTLTLGNSSCGIRLNYTVSATRQ